MSDAQQKALKKRLKVLMNRPENQVCSDCPERQPRWASLIVPPPGAPAGSLPIGAFCCLECSGSHRRLGVHISFVRSVNLDSWKEKEVLSMENGGNSKVNAIFEARLNVQKPSNHADGPTRERFIRDKYERRKFYDPAAFERVAAAPPPEPAPQRKAPAQTSRQQAQPQQQSVTPSPAARRRLEARRSSGVDSVSSTNARATGPPARQLSRKSSSKSRGSTASSVSSAPPVGDLLDFSSEPAETKPKVTRKKSKENDLMGFTVAAPQTTTPHDDFADFGSATTRSTDNAFGDFSQAAATPAPAPPANKNASLDIMNLYNTPRGGGGNNSSSNMMMMNGGGMMNNNNMMMNNGNNSNNNNMQQQQNMANMTAMMQQMNMQNGMQGGGMQSMQNNPQMQQQAMMYQQHMMRLQQQQMRGSMPAGGSNGMMGNNGMMMNNNNSNNMAQRQGNMSQSMGANMMMMNQMPSMMPRNSGGRSSDGQALTGLAAMQSLDSTNSHHDMNDSDPFASLSTRNGF